MALPRVYAAQKIDWTRDDISARQFKRARSDQNPRTIKTVCDTETPRQFDRLAARDQPRPLPVLERRDNHRSRAHAEMHIAFRLAIAETRLLKLLDHVQRDAHRFVPMMRVRFRKTKESDHALGIRGLDISSGLQKS